MGGVEKNLFADEFKKHKNQETTIGVWELMGCDEDEATRVSPCQGGDDDMQAWSEVASKSGSLPDGATITAAELEGLSSLISFLHAYYQSYDKALSNICAYSPMNYQIIRSLVLADLV